MWKKRLAVLAVATGAAVALSIPALSTAAKGKPAATGAKGDGRETCYGCHEEVKALKEGSKHARLACDSCHGAPGQLRDQAGHQSGSGQVRFVPQK